jgi:hypothetical protein
MKIVKKFSSFLDGAWAQASYNEEAMDETGRG